MRSPRVLVAKDDPSVFGPLTGPVTRKKFLVLDLESKDGDSQRPGFTRPFMCGVTEGDDFIAFYDKNHDDGHSWQTRFYKKGGCVDQMMRYICQKKFKGYHIYSHFGGNFDMLFILRQPIAWFRPVACLSAHFG